MNTHIETIMEQTELLFSQLMVIYNKYETKLNEFMNGYYENYQKYQDKLYDEFVKEKGISFQSSYQDTLLIPSVAYSFSLTVGESFLIHPKRSYILCCVHILHTDQIKRNIKEAKSLWCSNCKSDEADYRNHFLSYAGID